MKVRKQVTKMTENNFVTLVKLCAERSVLKKLIFSRPKASEIQKVTARLTERRGIKNISFEYQLPGNTVSQKNISLSALEENILPLLEEYRQTNLITTVSDVERKLSKKGKELIAGADKLISHLSDGERSFESAVEAIDKKKNYIFSGSEDFLIKLGISDKSGRVHDKKQGKFRQINRFCENIEAVYDKLPSSGEITVYDLCSGKSYLSFAVYYYLCKTKGRDVYMLGVDLKRDVIDWCRNLARELGWHGMHFMADDVKNTPQDKKPDLLISLHACDIATDIVINEAIRLGAKIILSTPCCHRYLNDKIKNDKLSFVSNYPHLRNKLCEALTDGIRIARLRANSYNVTALELTDPENTPKNTLIRAILDENIKEDELRRRKLEYDEILTFVTSDGKNDYLKEISRENRGL